MVKAISFFTALFMCFLSLFGNGLTKNYKVAAPTGTGTYTEVTSPMVTNADFYVSVTGNDNNNGTFAAPFATLARAQRAVTQMNKTGKSGITVAITAGEYRIGALRFGAEDSGTADCPVTYTAYGDGEVVLNGGVTLNPADFKPVTDGAMKARLQDSAKEKVLCCDLGQSGITAADYGKIYAIGSYNTAAKYTGDWTGPLYCELFVNDNRCNLARYPDTGYTVTGKVLEIGEGSEKSTTEKNPDWATSVDPKSETYQLSAELSKRIASWATLDDVWMFGYFKHDWADASTPIGSFDEKTRTLSPKFVSMYGAKDDAPCYFFNVFEEMTVPGEWYLDRAKGVLYLYPTEDFQKATVDLSLCADTLLTGTDLKYVTFNGITFKGTRGDAVNLTGDNLTVSRCLVKNVAGNAIRVSGYNNTVTRNEITHTGKGGIYIDGGDRETLTPGNSKADNNYIHDWSEIYQTYQPAVTLTGVGNICSHNEMVNSPHEAITFSGNNHLIEYNNIRRVCLLTNDGGAIYSGRRWDCYGTVIRYNCIADIGSGDFVPDGIYMDDALSGEIIYGNILVNIPKYAIFIGGGRDFDVRNNIVINCNDSSLRYDDRARAAYEGGWYNGSINQNWNALHSSPYKSNIWQQAYPAMQRFSEDEKDFDSPNFVPNPAYSVITGNLTVSLNGKIGNICESAQKFSTIENNAVYRMTKLNSLFVDPANGDYTLKEDAPVFDILPDFAPIPLSQIGRY